MPDTVVTNPDAVKLSTHDLETIKALETDVVYGIQENGFHTYQTRVALTRAFQLGFTAVNRGEAEGQVHPPKPGFMTPEAVALEDAGYRVGAIVAWESQSRSFRAEKQGQVVEVVYPGGLPDDQRFPGLYKTGIGKPRNHISFVVEVRKVGSSAKPKHYWPRVPALNVISFEPLSK